MLKPGPRLDFASCPSDIEIGDVILFTDLKFSNCQKAGKGFRSGA